MTRAKKESDQEKWDRLWGDYIGNLKVVCANRDASSAFHLALLANSIAAIKREFPIESKGMFPDA